MRNGWLYITQEHDRLVAAGDFEGMKLGRRVGERFEQLRDGQGPGNGFAMTIDQAEARFSQLAGIRHSEDAGARTRIRTSAPSFRLNDLFRAAANRASSWTKWLDGFQYVLSDLMEE